MFFLRHSVENSVFTTSQVYYITDVLIQKVYILTVLQTLQSSYLHNSYFLQVIY